MATVQTFFQNSKKIDKILEYTLSMFHQSNQLLHLRSCFNAMMQKLITLA